MIFLTHIVISLQPGGLEKLVVDMTNERNRQMAGSTRICCLDEEGTLAREVDGNAVFCVHAQRSRFPWDGGAAERMRDEIRNLNLEADSADQNSNLKSQVSSLVLHAHNMAAWQYAILAARGTGVKVVYTQHGANPHVRGWFNRIRMRWLLACTEQVVAVSNATAESMVKTLGVPGGRVKVVPNGIRVRDEGGNLRLEEGKGMFRAEYAEIAEKKYLIRIGDPCFASEASAGHRRPIRIKMRMEGVNEKISNGNQDATQKETRQTNDVLFSKTTLQRRAELGIPENALVIGSVGRMSAEKNYSLLIHAFAVFLKNHSGGYLMLVGDGPERALLEQLAETLGIKERIRFTGYRHETRELLGVMDMFCLSSDSEGMSLALLEAGACGLPAVVTNVGGNSEIVENEKSGIVVLPRNVDLLAKAFARMHDDKLMRKRMGAALRLRVMDHFSIEGMMFAYERIYAGGGSSEQ